MDSSYQGILQKMGNNFLVAAFVPAMGFVVCSLFIFQPIIPPDIAKYIGVADFSNLEPSKLGAFTIITLLSTTLLGFTLYTLGTYIYKSFEGYTFFLGLETSFRRILINRQKKRAKKIMLEREIVDKEINKLDKVVHDKKNKPENSWQKKRIERKKERLSDLKDRRYALISYYDSNFPPSNYLLPTRFGNILRAAEVYPHRYGIDAVTVWGRLAHSMPDAGMEKIDQANNQCLFLLNCCILTVLFSALSFLVAGYQALITLFSGAGLPDLLYFIPIDKPILIYQQRVIIYILLSVLAALLARFFYEASLLNVGLYGSMVRSAFDLYRFGLFEALHLPLPENSADEKVEWKKISEFFTGTWYSKNPPEFEYQHIVKQNNSSKDELPNQ